MPSYDLQALRDAAGKLTSLGDEFEQCRGSLADDALPGTPFGMLAGGERATAAIRGFQEKVRTEFGTAASHLDESAQWLRSTAAEVDQIDADNGQHVARVDDESGL